MGRRLGEKKTVPKTAIISSKEERVRPKRSENTCFAICWHFLVFFPLLVGISCDHFSALANKFIQQHPKYKNQNEMFYNNNTFLRVVVFENSSSKINNLLPTSDLTWYTRRRDDANTQLTWMFYNLFIARLAHLPRLLVLFAVVLVIFFNKVSDLWESLEVIKVETIFLLFSSSDHHHEILMDVLWHRIQQKIQLNNTHSMVTLIQWTTTAKVFPLSV